MKKRIVSILLLTLCLTLIFSIYKVRFAAEDDYTKINKDTSLYSLPLLNSCKIANLKNGDEVMVLSQAGEWDYISTNEESGWVFKSAIEEDNDDSKENTEESEENNQEEENTIDTADNEENNTLETEKNINNTQKNSSDKLEAKENANANASNTEDAPKSQVSQTAADTTIKYPANLYVNVPTVNIRETPSTTGKLVEGAIKGQVLHVTAKEGDWCKVETSTANGYVMAKYLSLTK